MAQAPTPPETPQPTPTITRPWPRGRGSVSAAATRPRRQGLVTTLPRSVAERADFAKLLFKPREATNIKQREGKGGEERRGGSEKWHQARFRGRAVSEPPGLPRGFPQPRGRPKSLKADGGPEPWAGRRVCAVWTASRVDASRFALVPGHQGLRGRSWGPGPCLAALLALPPSALGVGDERWL